MNYTITKSIDYIGYEQTLKKIFPSIYKSLNLDYYIRLQKGVFPGKLIGVDKEDNIEKYECKINYSEIFEKVHGEIKFIYEVNENKKTIILNKIEPTNFFEDAKEGFLDYKNCIVTKKNKTKDMYKIDLITMLNKDK